MAKHNMSKKHTDLKHQMLGAAARSAVLPDVASLSGKPSTKRCACRLSCAMAAIESHASEHRHNIFKINIITVIQFAIVLRNFIIL